MKSKKIAICSVQVPFVRGGAEKLVDSLYKELLKRKFNVDVINLPFKWYPPSRLVTECMIWRLLDLSESCGEKIDIVISTKFPSTVIKHSDKRIWLVHQQRTVYELHGTDFKELEYSKEHYKIRDRIFNIDKTTIKEAKRIFTISKNVSKRLKRYNDIDSLPLYPPPPNIEKFYSGDYGDYILYVGRLENIKRVSLLLEAFKFTRSNIKCLIVGTGMDKNNLENLINNYKINHKARLLGYLSTEKVLELYANARAVFYAPYDEDYGFATVEAFLSKRPVITTFDSGGVLEFVENNVSGFVLKTDPIEIAEKIDQLFENKEKCRELGSNGYEIVKNISWDRVIERLVH